MPQPTGNQVSTTPGLIKPISFGNTNQSPSASGFTVPKTQAGGTNPIPGLISGISNFIGPMGGNQTTPMFASGNTTKTPSVGSFAQSSAPQGTSYSLNGVNYDAGGSPVNSVASTQTATPPVQPTSGTTPPAMGTPEYQTYLDSINAGNMKNGQFINDANQNLGTQTGTQGNQGGTQGTVPTVGGAASGLLGLAGTQSDAYKAAQEQYNQANEQLKALKLAAANNQFIGAGTNMAEYAGTQGLVANRLANQENALVGEMQAAQQAAQVATGQQSTQQSGFAQAGGLVTPQVGAYGQTQYLPTGGTVGGGTGAGVSPSDPFYQTMQTYAEALANGQSSAIPSSISGNPALQAQLLQMAKQINPNFNYNQSVATGASQQAQRGQAQQYQSAAQQAQNLGMQLNQVIQNTGVNPSDINAANKALQAIASNTSNPNYATFQNLITDLANTYAQVLTPAGGSTTDMVRTISGSLLDSSMKGSGISQVMQNLDAQVQAKIAGVTTAYGTQSNTQSGNQPAGWF